MNKITIVKGKLISQRKLEIPFLISRDGSPAVSISLKKLILYTAMQIRLTIMVSQSDL